MPTIDNATLDRLRRNHSLATDVWFLSGSGNQGDEVQHFPIDQHPYVVGRKSGVSLKLNFRTVSGNHASLWVENGQLHLKDLGSTNGTFVNGQRLSQPVVIDEEDLIHFAEAPFRVRRQSISGCTAGTVAENVCDQALALVQFDRLMSQRLVRPHFQPIVFMHNQAMYGYEVLGRGKVFGLESVGAMFQAAEQLNLAVQLSQLLRWEGIRVGRELPNAPVLFVNTHPKELEDTRGLIESLRRVRELSDNTKLVLEIHESAVTSPGMMQNVHACLRDLNIGLAYDDFGSGQARLTELIEARPDYVKFDISLVRGIDSADENRLRALRTLVQMVRDLEIQALAEGIETLAEATICEDLGFQLAQGFFYGRPVPA
jgi:EAL domain-containing protein (putative c-di-GMP-specific phosphodiesterase class I)